MKFRILILAVLALSGLLMAADSPTVTPSRDDALTSLVSGNARFMAAKATAASHAAVSGDQHPIACIVSCSDARVCPEILFDQSMGSLYVVRNAGLTPTADVVASVEYAVKELKVPVVIVLGHSDCKAIAPAQPVGNVETAAYTPGAAAAPVAPEPNARLTAAALLESSQNILNAVMSHQTALICGNYSLTSGAVTFQTELAAVSLPQVKQPVVEAAAAVATPESKAAPKVEAAAAKAETKPEAAVTKEEPKKDTPASSEQPKPKRKADPSAAYTRRAR